MGTHQSLAMDKKGLSVVKRWEALDNEAGIWKKHWDQVARYIVPKKDNVYGQAVNGDERTNHLYDATSVHANELLASALVGMLINPALIWFSLTTGDDRLDMDDDVQAWIQDTVLRMMFYMNNSNFNTEAHELFTDIPSFGTGIMMVDEHSTHPIYFTSGPVYNYAIDENEMGIVDTVFRKYEYTGRQAVKFFGEKVLEHRLIKEVYDREMKTGNCDRKLEIIHGVYPRETDYGKPDVSTNLPFASCHVLRDDNYVLKESGYHENPYIVPRWSKVAGEKYGRGPGMKALPDIRMLNTIMKTSLSAAQLAIAPPWQVPDDGVLLPLKTHPHAVNMVRSGSKDEIRPLLSNPRIDIGYDIMNDVRTRIKQAFFIDQLQLNEQGPQMTATEVMQRTEEKLRLLGPVQGRMHFEYLDPLIRRVYGILSRRRLLPEVPEKLANRKLSVKFVSQIAKAQRASEADSFSRLLQVAAPILEWQPQALDYLDGDEIVRYLSNIYGVNHLLLKDKTVVKKMRDQRAQQEQAQQQAQMDNMQADTVGKMSKAIGPEGM